MVTINSVVETGFHMKVCINIGWENENILTELFL